MNFYQKIPSTGTDLLCNDLPTQNPMAVNIQVGFKSRIVIEIPYTQFIVK